MAVLMRWVPSKNRCLFVSMAACILAIGVTCANAQPAAAPEYEIKAAFVYNFAKFVEWPEDAFSAAEATMSLCVMDGSPPLGKALESIQGKTVKGRAITIRQCEDMGDIAACHILIVGPMERKRAARVLEEVKGRRILTIGDEKGFAQLGGIINFVSVGNKISFEINVDAAKCAGLEISSKLLRLAKIVREKP